MSKFEEINDPFEKALQQVNQENEGKSAAESGNPGEPDQPPGDSAGISAMANDDEKRNLQVLMDIEVEVAMEVGYTTMLLSDLLLLGQGSVIELDRLVGDDLDIIVADKRIGTADVVILQEHFGARMKTVVSREKRLESLKK